jgi:F-type H+-transporting ATPase subunit gamma
VAEHIREIKRRIGNISNIRQITKAMHAIALTKATRMKRELIAERPYAEALDSALAAILAEASRTELSHPLLTANSATEVAILVLNADQGLCGRFKGTINRAGYDLLRNQNGKGRIIAGGEKARSFFTGKVEKFLKVYSHLYEQPTSAAAKQIATDLLSLYQSSQVGTVYVVYMRFFSELIQHITVDRILPIRPSEELSPTDALVEPNLSRILDYFLPTYIRGKIFHYLLETKMCEHTIRRQAMKAATDNADDLIKSLTLTHNKARQQAITRAIAEIIAGGEEIR